jgi:hypothetical protein
VQLRAQPRGSINLRRSSDNTTTEIEERLGVSGRALQAANVWEDFGPSRASRARIASRTPFSPRRLYKGLEDGLVEGVHHVTFLTEDIDRLSAFYGAP